MSKEGEIPSLPADTFPELILDGPRATIRLSRPTQHNRIDPDDLEVLVKYLSQINSDARLRVLVLTGTGTRTFSSGYTIQAIRGGLDDRFETMLDLLESLPLPVICALNGSAYGGATDMALCCDFRIGVAGSVMRMPASKFGLHYYPGGIRRFVTRLGLSASKKLFLTAQAIDAEEMLRIGFLSELVDPECLNQVVTRYVDAILGCEPSVLRSMKHFLNDVADGKTNVAAQRAAYELSLRSTALKERLQARSTTSLKA
jgi:enoyl-CoA hydratase/carnithine racemase